MEMFLLKKYECVGHVQKRMGSRLRNLRKSLKGQVLSDGKKISGKGRLSDKVINTMQNYYGLAIRQNAGELYQMKKSVGAILYHLSQNENDEDRHKFCPPTKDSWCKFQSDKLTGKTTYKKKVNLPKAIKDAVMPTFKDLSKDELLTKCLHGQTQNANEALNKIIWQRCPKSIFVSRKVVEIATASAILYFNDGCEGINRVFKALGFQPGAHTLNLASEIDHRRIRNMKRKSTEKVKKRRKQLRSIKKGFQDTETEKEGEVYAAGSF